MAYVQVVTYNPKYLRDFIALNTEWIQTYFTLEPMDVAQLENPQENILRQGGEIFFVLQDEVVVGTCAMVVHGPACYELAKMAVRPEVRGKGYGDLLMETAIDWARTQRAEKVMLLSNTRLEPAIGLYRKHGFRVVNLGSHPDYQRCNIEMEISLSGQSVAHANY